MKIEWCEIHKCQTNPYDDDQTQCLAATHVVGVTGDCRMVPMRLIPDNGELSAMLSQVTGEQIEYQPGYWVWQMEVEIRDAILAALDGETP